jgi:hypothetical protein
VFRGIAVLDRGSSRQIVWPRAHSSPLWLEIRLVGLRHLGVLSSVAEKNKFKGLGQQTSDNCPIGNKGLFPEVANCLGRGPPGNEKPAGAANLDGVKSEATNLNKSTVVARKESDKPNFCDWRIFYDNARGKTDEAISAVYRALGDGLIDDSEAAALDLELRSRQAKIARKPPGLAQIAHHLCGSGKSKLALGWPRRRPRRMPDREKSRQRARMLGGSSSMPPRLRAAYTECERAALTIIAREVKRHGICDLSVAQIAAEAGIGIRTMQNAVAEAIRQGHICREERPQKGRKNLTNILRIVSLEWIAWIKRGPVGCKEHIPTKIIDSKQEHSRQFPRVARIIRVSG